MSDSRNAVDDALAELFSDAWGTADGAGQRGIERVADDWSATRGGSDADGGSVVSGGSAARSSPPPGLVLVMSFFALAVSLCVVTLIVAAAIKTVINSPAFWQWMVVFLAVKSTP